MFNEKGMTLTEVLAALLILGIAAVLASMVIMNGTRSSSAISSDQRLQQEANLITEIVRQAYLEEKGSQPGLILETEGEQLLLNGKVISEGFVYEAEIYSENDHAVQFNLKIEKGGRTYEMETAFSKLGQKNPRSSQ